MSEIAKYEASAAEIAEVQSARQSAGMAALEMEVAVMEKAAPLVTTLIDGGMAPARYLPGFVEKKGGQPLTREQALARGMAAAVYGASLGFSVTASLQNVFNVHGTPTIYARTAVALVIGQGHEVWVGDESADSVTVYGRRRGSDKVFESTWDIARAERAGFTSNAKYKTQPQEMLYAKAAMAVCRRMAPDVLAGIPYSTEEMELEPKAPIHATAKRMDKPRGAAGLRAALDPKPEPAEDEAPADELMAGVKLTIDGFTTTDEVEAFMASIADDPGELTESQQAAIREMATARWHAVNDTAGEK